MREDVPLLVTDDVLLRIDLDVSTLVAHIDEHALAHVAMRGDAPGDSDLTAFDVIGAGGGAGFGGSELVFERVNALCTQSVELFAALLDQRIRIIHRHAAGNRTPIIVG